VAGVIRNAESSLAPALAVERRTGTGTAVIGDSDGS
jgi:hypothetical protein